MSPVSRYMMYLNSLYGCSNNMNSKHNVLVLNMYVLNTEIRT